MTETEFHPGVRFPERRHELLWYLHELASDAHQRAHWIAGAGSMQRSPDGLDFVVHFLFDDTDLGADPRRTLGDILKDDIEVASVRRVSEALQSVLNALPTGAADVEYLNLPGWKRVLAASRDAYRLLRTRLASEGDKIIPPPLD